MPVDCINNKIYTKVIKRTVRWLMASLKADTKPWNQFIIKPTIVPLFNSKHSWLLLML